LSSKKPVFLTWIFKCTQVKRKLKLNGGFSVFAG
jgi:hypothetical protein